MFPPHPNDAVSAPPAADTVRQSLIPVPLGSLFMPGARCVGSAAAGTRVFSLPVRRAIAELAPRVVVFSDGRLVLDGRPSAPRQLVREANRLRRRIGLSPIRYPGEDA